MPRVKAYRKKDGTFVRTHARAGVSVAAFSRRIGKGSLRHLKRTSSRYGQVRLDRLSVANLRRYGKPNAFGHKPRLEPTRPGRDLHAAREYSGQAREALGLMRSAPLDLSRAHYKGRFLRSNKAKRIAKRGKRS